MTEGTFRCGYVALVGRPNVGKSTLLNRILGQKISITSRRPQTTRHRILGVKTGPHAQAVYLDTPGLHQGAKRAINRFMNRAAGAAIQEVDVVVMVVQALRWTPDDAHVLEKSRGPGRPLLLAVNMVDRVKDKRLLLPFLDQVSGHASFDEIIPLSARTGANVSDLEGRIEARLPVAHPLFPEHQVTDRSERFLAAELIREKFMRSLGQELPYRVSVDIERFEERPGQVEIHAVIYVERASQKAIVIGNQGQMLKHLGSQARQDLESMLGRTVYLKTWVKVRENWSDDERALRSMGYQA